MDETTVSQPNRRRLSFSLWMLLLLLAIFAAMLGAFRSGYERGHVAGAQHPWDATVETRWYPPLKLGVTHMRREDLEIENLLADLRQRRSARARQ